MRQRRLRGRVEEARPGPGQAGMPAKHNLQFYKESPTDTISLFQFETLAAERLKGLHAKTA